MRNPFESFSKKAAPSSTEKWEPDPEDLAKMVAKVRENAPQGTTEHQMVGAATRMLRVLEKSGRKVTVAEALFAEQNQEEVDQNLAGKVIVGDSSGTITGIAGSPNEMARRARETKEAA